MVFGLVAQGDERKGWREKVVEGSENGRKMNPATGFPDVPQYSLSFSFALVLRYGPELPPLITPSQEGPRSTRVNEGQIDETYHQCLIDFGSSKLNQKINKRMT